jgi:hypothetical protein
MTVHFLACELPRWDHVEASTLVLTFFADERPLRGAAGLADWRMCGRLSRLLKHGRLRGGSDETLMMPPGRRLRFERLLLFGLGEAGAFNEDTYRRHVGSIRRVLERAKVRDYAVQPPGRATGLIAARRALEIWLEVSGNEPDAEGDVYIIDTSGAQKEMADILHAHQRYAMARREREARRRSAAPL